VISVEELLEGAISEADALAALQRFTVQGLHLAQARRCALLQRRTSRRLGENDAWLVATAVRRGKDGGLPREEMKKMMEASEKEGAPWGTIMNSCGSSVLSACAPPFNTLSMGTGSVLAAGPPR